MEPDASLLCCENPATGIYRKPDEPNSHPPNLFLYDPPTQAQVFRVMSSQPPFLSSPMPHPSYPPFTHYSQQKITIRQMAELMGCL